MGISLQESNSGNLESDIKGLSKAKLAENSWMACWRHRKKNLLSLEEKNYQVSSLACTWHWVGIMVSYLIFIYQIKGNIDHIPHSLFKVWIQSNVTDFKTICWMNYIFTCIFMRRFPGCFPIIKIFWKLLFAKHLQNQFLTM